MSAIDREKTTKFISRFNKSTKFTEAELENKFYKLAVKYADNYNQSIEEVYKSLFYDLSAVIVNNFDDFYNDLINDNLGWSGIEHKVLIESIDDEVKQIVEQKWVKAGTSICSKCGSRRIELRQEQKRSSDEGATNIYTCSVCNNSWAINN